MILMAGIERRLLTLETSLLENRKYWSQINEDVSPLYIKFQSQLKASS